MAKKIENLTIEIIHRDKMIYNPVTMGKDEIEIIKMGRRSEAFMNGEWFHFDFLMIAEGGGKKVVHKSDKIYVSDVDRLKNMRNYTDNYNEFEMKVKLAGLNHKDLEKPSFNTLMTKAKVKIKLKNLKKNK